MTFPFPFPFSPRLNGALQPHLQLALALILSAALSACGGGSSDSAGTSASSSSVESTTSAAATVSISASPTAATVGQVVTLTWSSSNVTAGSCTASGAWNGSQATSGSLAVTPASVGTLAYTLTCGSVSNTASVVVSAAAVVPTVSIALTPAAITTADSAQLTWSSANASACTASGAWSGSQATSGSVAVTKPAAGTYTYSLTCSGSGGSATGSANLAVSAVSNTVSMVVDNGPDAANGSINVPYVNVTVCRPGTTVCQTIDHVMVDTGSYGLRLMAPLNTALALPAVTTPSGAAAGECGQFVSGYTWGSVQQADVKLAGLTASGISIQVIGDTNTNFANVPGSCSSAGTNLGTVAALGANGILGIGLFKQDCGSACAARAVSGVYYGCTGGSCTSSAMPLASQVSNPAAAFPSDNNGVILSFPSVATGGATTLTGTLIFGIDSQTNNASGSEKVYLANSSGNFSTTYKNRNYTASFIDSGSNGIFFTDSTITSCSSGSGFFCPSSTLSLSAVNAAYDGSVSGTISFNVVSTSRLSSSIVAAPLGGSLTSSSGTSLSTAFDWGLPFFFGRKVYVVFEDGVTKVGTGPYWAY